MTTMTPEVALAEWQREIDAIRESLALQRFQHVGGASWYWGDDDGRRAEARAVLEEAADAFDRAYPKPEECAAIYNHVVQAAATLRGPQSTGRPSRRGGPPQGLRQRVPTLPERYARLVALATARPDLPPLPALPGRTPDAKVRHMLADVLGITYPGVNTLLREPAPASHRVPRRRPSRSEASGPRAGKSLVIQVEQQNRAILAREAQQRGITPEAFLGYLFEVYCADRRQAARAVSS